MRTGISSTMFLFALACAPLPAAESLPSGWPRQVLSNEGIVRLARAGYNDRFLMDLITRQDIRFDTSVEGLVYFAKNGVSERVVRAVLVAEQARLDRERQQLDEPRGAESPATPTPPSSAPLAPVKLRVVKQKVLVPESAGVPMPVNAAIYREPSWLGDRYWALPAPGQGRPERPPQTEGLSHKTQ